MSQFRRFNVWFNDTEPVNLRNGQLWVDTTTNLLYSKIDNNVEPIGLDINNVIAQIVGAAPETLNTLDEIAQALNDNPDVLDLFLSASTASATYLTQSNASTTYQAKVANVSDTEIGYLDGVTSAIQTQLDAKLASATAASTYAPKTWVNPTSATAGQVLTANGSGGSSFQTPSGGGTGTADPSDIINSVLFFGGK